MPQFHFIDFQVLAALLLPLLLTMRTPVLYVEYSAFVITGFKSAAFQTGTMTSMALMIPVAPPQSRSCQHSTAKSGMSGKLGACWRYERTPLICAGPVPVHVGCLAPRPPSPHPPSPRPRPIFCNK